MNDSYFLQTDVQLSDPIFSQLSSIASHSTLGAGLLSQALDSTPTKPLLANPQQEPILVEVTDASTTAENVNFSLMLVEVFFFNFLIYLVFYPSPDFLLMPDTSRGNT